MPGTLSSPSFKLGKLELSSVLPITIAHLSNLYISHSNRTEVATYIIIAIKGWKMIFARMLHHSKYQVSFHTTLQFQVLMMLRYPLSLVLSVEDGSSKIEHSERALLSMHWLRNSRMLFRVKGNIPALHNLVTTLLMIIPSDQV